MRKLKDRAWRALIPLLWVSGAVWALAACTDAAGTAPAATPTPGAAMPAANPTIAFEVAVSQEAPESAPLAEATIGPIPTSSPTSSPTPTATPTPATLVVCQKEEPLSLYLYGDNTTARAGIFEALFDGPIDSVGYAYQPVLLQALPSLENGGLTVSEVEVQPGDQVVDAATGAVTHLQDGVQLMQADGSRVLYSGSAPARTLQLAAVFKLKEGLRWSDGQALSADDSVFSFQVAADAATPTSKIFTDRTASYVAEDALTVRWTGVPGWLDTDYFLRFWTPLPRHLYGTLSAADLLKDSGAARQPLGWGAFNVEAWQPGEALTLTRNANYFRAAEGLPRLDQVVFRFGLDDTQVLAEIQAGRCDIGEASTGWQDQLPALLTARTAGWLAPQFVPDTAFEHLDFGIVSETGYKRPAGEDLFQDVRVRQAFAYCLDRQALDDQLLYGLAQVPTVYLPSGHPLLTTGPLTRYDFDPARGQALLKEAGWADVDGDGIRENGKRKLSLEYAELENDAFRAQLAQLVQAQLRQNCGIDAQLKLYPPEQLYGAWPQGLLFGRKFDLGGFPWRVGIDPPCNLYMTESIPSATAAGATGTNDLGYSNADFDRACHAALTALDAPTRQTMQAQAEVIFAREVPSLVLFFQVKAGVAGPRVQGYHLDSTAPSDLWNIETLGVTPP